MDFIFDPSLVLYLPLYELDGSSFTSKDAYGHLGTVTGALWRPQGHYFDGTDDKLDCGNPTGLQLTGDITIEAVVKPTTGADMFISSKDGGAGDRGWYFVILADGTVRFFVSYDGTKYSYINSSLTLTSGEWVHVCGVHLGTNLYMYVDHQDVSDVVSHGGGATSVELVINDSSVNYLIGEKAGVNRYNGLMGEYRAYNRGLNPLEVQHNDLATKWRYR